MIIHIGLGSVKVRRLIKLNKILAPTLFINYANLLNIVRVG